jgi:hypothetical protein
MRFSRQRHVAAPWRTPQCVPARMPSRLGAAVAIALLTAGLLAAGGCAQSPAPRPVLQPRYPDLGARKGLPKFMEGTIHEICDVSNNEPYPVSGYGLVTRLHNTGNNRGVPSRVYDYIVRSFMRHGVGPGAADDRMVDWSPAKVLGDPQTAIVEVYGFLPPGARKDQRVDVYVRAVESSQTTSLARGILWTTELKVDGANPIAPAARVDVFMYARGNVFVNPSYVSNAGGSQPAVQASLRSGVIMGGGRVLHDRPLHLILRTPSLRTARTIEACIDHRFENENAARAQDEGMVHLFVPRSYNGNWEHFVGVVNHLYLDAMVPGVGANRARDLVQEALKPGAPLKNISYCWEGIGPEALPFIKPLYAHPRQDVAFAAARAGAFITDIAAEDALLDMAMTPDHEFRLNAVRTLGELRPSTRMSRMLTRLLSSDNALVRIEAYRILAAQGDSVVQSFIVKDRTSGEPVFIIDRVDRPGPPLVWASRSGVPRIAILGPGVSLKLPLMFSAMDHRLTISTARGDRDLVIFDRSNPRLPAGVEARSGPRLDELLLTLAGHGDSPLSLGYPELVGILQALDQERHLNGLFVLQDAPLMEETIADAPPIAASERSDAGGSGAAASAGGTRGR